MIGTTVSHYKILEKLGEGGMGIVYKAHDTRLERDVALKFLPANLSASGEEQARFLQEAKAAGTLDHPNICTIYSIEEHEGQIFIAMQYIDGQLLRDRIKGMSQKQAIEIGIQIADGLAAAHEKGIVHRDIKPDNIMVRKDGIVQIMDFGLAKLRGVTRLTKEGSTVGTAGYMSPEQVQGLDADHRSDIFSLGCVLYELLTGSQPFKGVHETAIMYEVVNVDVAPPSSLTPSIEPELDRIVLECLQKEPDERCQSAKEVSRDLKRYKRESGRQHISRVSAVRALPRAGAGPIVHEQPSDAKPGKVVFIPWLVAAAVAVAAVAWMLLSPHGGPGKDVRRLNLSAIMEEGQQIYRSDIPSIALSPDGRLLAYSLTKGGVSQLYLRPLSSFDAKPIKGTEGGTSPFFSPDGQWLGFVADGKILKIPVSGGGAEKLCDAPGFRGACWAPDGRIIFSPEFASGLMSVSATGGPVKVFSILDSARHERTHRWPQVLPGGKWVLYTVGDQSNPNSYLDAPLVMQSLETGERHTLDARGEMARYVDPGYLVVGRNGSLLVAPFDLSEFRMTRALTACVSGVNGDPGSGVLDYSISNDGQLVYLPGSLNLERELVWVSREGAVTPLPLPPRPYYNPRISPDGTRIAVVLGGLVTGNDNDIWIYDLRSTTFTRLTFEKSIFTPYWSRDGKQLYCGFSIGGNEGIMTKPVDGSSAGTILLSGKTPRFPTYVSPDGGHMIFGTLSGPSEGDIFVYDVNAAGEPRPLIATPSYEADGIVSPNGKFLLYQTNASGPFEIMVATYPDLKGKWQVSVNGGAMPMWSPDGTGIFYVNTIGQMMSVAVQTTGGTFKADKPREMFDASEMFFPNAPVVNYEIAPDGKRFIFVRNSHSNSSTTSFNVVLNWAEELKRELPLP